MATIEELRRQIQRERNIAQGKKEIAQIGFEKSKLEKELAELRKQNSGKGDYKKDLAYLGRGLQKMGSNLLNVAGTARKNLESKEKGLGLFG